VARSPVDCIIFYDIISRANQRVAIIKTLFLFLFMNYHDRIGGFQVAIYAQLSKNVIAPGIDLSFICERQRMHFSGDHLN